MFVSTNTLPSLAVWAETVFLLPSINTNVDDRPRPLRLTFDVPCVDPEVNESALFSAPLLAVKFLVISATVVAPRSSIVSLLIISTGAAPSVALPLIYEPVTTTSSTSSAKEIPVNRTNENKNERINFMILPLEFEN